MTALRDALAAALADVDYMNWRPDEVARLVLERRALRVALVEAVAEALTYDPGWFPLTSVREDASAIVARMLGDEEVRAPGQDDAVLDTVDADPSVMERPR